MTKTIFGFAKANKKIGKIESRGIEPAILGTPVFQTPLDHKRNETIRGKSEYISQPA